MEDFSFGFIFGLVFGLGLGVFFVDSSWERDMIGRGYAEYCPKSGEFAFIGECDK
jgi:hypothetical protein